MRALQKKLDDLVCQQNESVELLQKVLGTRDTMERFSSAQGDPAEASRNGDMYVFTRSSPSTGLTYYSTKVNAVMSHEELARIPPHISSTR
jgi:hypothetical protein